MVIAHANHLVSTGHDVTILAAVVDTVFSIDRRVIVQLLPFPSKLFTILKAVVTSFAADLLVADIIPIATLLALRNHRRIVYFAQDDDESYYSNPFMKKLIRLFSIIGLLFCRIPVITVSPYLADLLTERFHIPIAVGVNGVDTSIFYSDPDHELLEGKSSRKSLLLLSRSDMRKGFDIAQAVINRLAVDIPVSFEVWTVGEQCTGFFGSLIHRDFGYVNESRLRRIMSSADLFLYPTRHEGFALMPLEAMACGCPVVTTHAVPYAVHGENAAVSPIADVERLTENCRHLLDHRSQHHRYAEQGRNFALGCSLSAAQVQFETLLTRCHR